MDVWLSASGIVIIVAMILLTFVLWKVAKLLLIPIQILLFLALMFIAFKLLFPPETMGSVSEGVTGEKIQGLVNSEVGKKIADKTREGIVQAGKAALDSVRSGEKAVPQGSRAVPEKAEAKTSDMKPAMEAEK